MTTDEQWEGGVLDGAGRQLDQIRLTGITAVGYHGVFDFERRDGQTFIADVVVHLDTRRAAARDDLAHTLHYGELAQQVSAVLSGDPVDLIETVAERIAATVLAQAIVQAVDVSVHKPQAPIEVPFGDVVVRIHRDRSKLPAAEPYLPRTGSDASAPGRSAPTPTASFPVTPAPGAPISAGVAAASGPVAPPVDAAPAGVPPAAPDATAAAASSVPVPAVAVPPATPPPVAAPVVPPVVPPRIPPAPAAVAAAAVLPPRIPWSEIVSPTGPAATVPPPPGELSSGGPDGPTEPVAAAQDEVPGLAVEPTPPSGTGLVETSSDAVVGEIVLDSLDVTPPAVVDVVLALGANLGAAQETLRAAVDVLSHTTGLEVVQVSPLARTTAVGGPDQQPDYLNAIVLARTMLSPRELLRVTQRIENAHGRVREERWGPRTLDIDIIVYGSVLAVTDDLELPHPRAHERAFVLEPWAQVDPDAVLPGLGGGPVAALAATAPDREGIRWLALDWLAAPAASAPAARTTDSPTDDDDGFDDGATERWEAPQT